MTNPAEEKLINSDIIQESIVYSLDISKEPPKSMDELLLKVKKRLALFFLHYLNENNPIIKDEAFLKDLGLYAYGICSAIDISMDINDQHSDSILNKFIENPEKDILYKEKQELAGILEEQISKQLSDIILGLSDVKEKLKDKENVMKQFDSLANACSESNEIVKDCIIDVLENALNYINKNDIEYIDYNSLQEIEDTQEMLRKWDIIIFSAETIVDNMKAIIDKMLYKNIEIKTDTKQQEDLKYVLSFFKTLANHLPELVSEKYGLPNLTAVHSSKNPLFKKFTRTELVDMPKYKIVEYIKRLHNTASNTRPSFLYRFKLLSHSKQLVIVLLIIIVIVGIATLLIYALNNKDALY
ncbi:hypothetical protein NEOKW01_1510 [Nematocida sp. AWRm80]|nr:hypothetical protein NEOKW01_1510 [Nematocida sp. AWRm80]